MNIYHHIVFQETEQDEEDDFEQIAQALIDSIGTDTEKQCWGFDVSELIRIIANEGGEDYQVCHAVTTACFNAQIKHNNRYDPLEICNLYNYDTSYNNKMTQSRWETAKLAVIDVYVYGVTFDTIEGATLFYAPNINGESEYHESQAFICEINGVKFFEEVI